MKKITQIKKELRNGDQILCAEITNLSEDYVKKVVGEKRNSEKIVFVLNEIVDNRKKLIKRLKSFNYKTQK